MTSIVTEQRTSLRAIGVFLGGAFISVVASALLDHFLLPNGVSLVTRLFTGVPVAEQVTFVHQLRQSVLITVYLVNPLVGILVGIFVGLLQKNYAMIVAALCLVPDFLFGIFADHGRVWTHSLNGIITYLMDNSLPFIAAVLTTGTVRYMLDRRTIHKEDAALTSD
jgi:hypothetical protein